jgi:general secretion pathway protein G
VKKRIAIITLVALVCGVFVTLIGSQFVSGLYYSRDSAAQSELQTLTTQLEVYKTLNGFYPTTDQGLEALVVCPTSSPVPGHWQQLVFLYTLLDPWHRRFIYRFPSPGDPATFDLFSLGADGIESAHDIRVAHVRLTRR